MESLMTEYKRNCPTCGKELFYAYKSSYTLAVANNQSCAVCVKSVISLSADKISQIIDLNSKGKSNREISKIIGVSTNTIKKYLDKNQLSSNWSFSAYPEMISQFQARCRICKNIFPISEFVFVKNNTRYSFDHCQNDKCKNKKYTDIRRENFEKKVADDITPLIHKKYIDLKAKCKRDDIPFNLSEDDFNNQFYSQKNLCFYTDEEMVIEFSAKPNKHGANRNALSIDKIIPSNGYVLGNVVFCCNKINFTKRDLSLEEIKKYLHPSFYERIMRFINKDIENAKD